MLFLSLTIGLVVHKMNTAKDLIKKLIDDLPESKAGQVVDFLLYLKNKPEQDLFITVKEEEELWGLIQTDERMSNEEVKEKLDLI